MTKEGLAAMLSGREIGNEITGPEEIAAKQSGLLVIFGSSDDLCELRGAISEEVGAWQGAEIFVSREGHLMAEFEDGDVDVLQRHGVMGHVKGSRAQAIKIAATWCDEEKGPAWTYKTDEPRATFDVMEDGEVWCRGIVIQL